MLLRKKSFEVLLYSWTIQHFNSLGPIPLNFSLISASSTSDFLSYLWLVIIFKACCHSISRSILSHLILPWACVFPLYFSSYHQKNLFHYSWNLLSFTHLKECFPHKSPRIKKSEKDDDAARWCFPSHKREGGLTLPLFLFPFVLHITCPWRPRLWLSTRDTTWDSAMSGLTKCHWMKKLVAIPF